MSPIATNAPLDQLPEEEDGNMQTWLKELERAEKLMDDLEAKTTQLDAKLDGLLADLQSSAPVTLNTDTNQQQDEPMQPGDAPAA